MLPPYISTHDGRLHRAQRATKGCTLVTGGAGFIGSHLCDRLIQHGHDVICLDNLYTGRIENIGPLRNHPRFRFIKHDVRERLELSDPIYQIYNLACAASPRHYQRDPVGTLQTCILGAQNILDLARRKSAKILQASTSEVYGDPQIHPQIEEYSGCVNPIGPRACYDEGKRAAETLFFDYRRVYGLSIKVARIFNTYGPRMLVNDGRVVSNFIVQALRNLPITVYGRGRQTRSLCYVEDLVDGLELLMASDDDIVGPCNLGNPNEMTIAQIADLIVQLTGSRSRIAYGPLPQDDPRRRRPAIDKAARLLGWRPRISIESGLQTTIGYFALQIFAAEPGDITPIGSSGRRRDQTSIAEIANGRLVPTPAQQP